MPRAEAAAQFGHYVVEALLGKGAMGTVYLGRDSRIGRRVALKTIQPSESGFEDAASSAEFFRRLQREAEVCGALHHPSIVTLYEVGYEGGRISYLALEYVAGESLLDLLKRHRPNPLPLPTTIGIAMDILNGLRYAHEKGIVHRDIKPGNILVSHEGVAKIADFGIARPQQSALTVAGAIMGTPNYMSPEQARGIEATPRSDLFSLGVMMFEMLTGTKPFAASDVHTTFQNIISAPLPLPSTTNPQVPPELDWYVQKLAEKSPDDRFASAAEALQHLQRIEANLDPSVAGTPASGDFSAPLMETERDSPTTSLEPPSVSWWRRRLPPAVFWSGVIVALAFAVVPALLIVPRIDSSPTVTISPEKLHEFAAKRQVLRQAAERFESGNYEESLLLYEQYLSRYPYSTVAQDGALRTRKALKGDAPRTVHRRKATRKPSTVEEIKRSLRRLFRGD